MERVSIAGAGYLNFHLNRARTASRLFALRHDVTEGRTLHGPTAAFAPGAKFWSNTPASIPTRPPTSGTCGMPFWAIRSCACFRFQGENVEIQNYIDNTGVQVADVVVGFFHLEKKSLKEVEALIHTASPRFDYYCWDLYARVFQLYEEKKEALQWRAQALKEIEEGQGETAILAEVISTAIVRTHLETMLRLNIQYDVLVQESEILKLHFWKAAFELLKRRRPSASKKREKAGAG